MQGLEGATWEEALVAAKDAISKVKGNEMSFIAGKLADAESLIALKVCDQSFWVPVPCLLRQQACTAVKKHKDCRWEGLFFSMACA